MCNFNRVKKFYVYIYLDPFKKGKFKYSEFEFGYEPFYVGKGSNDRLLDHIKYPSSENPSKNEKINSIKKGGKNPVIIKYNTNLDEESSFKLEKKMIHTIGRKISGEGPLLNIQYGGQGFSGGNSKEWTLISPTGKSYSTNRLSDFCKDNSLKIGSLQLVAMAKMLHSDGWLCFKKGEEEETLKRLQILRLKRLLTEIIRRNKLKISSTGRKKSIEEKKKIGLAAKGNKYGLGFKHSEKVKKIIGINSKNNWDKNIERKIELKNRMIGNKYSKGAITEAHKKKLRKSYSFKSPSGKIITTTNLKDFCERKNLNYYSMNAIANNNQKSHKGWTRGEDKWLKSVMIL